MRKLCVLLVDSNRDNRELYDEYLRVSGARTICSPTTDDALLNAEAADVVVTGIHVDGTFDGLELVRRLRAHPATHQVPVIVLTASAFASDRARAFEAGCDTFVSKPCEPERLVREINRVFLHNVAPATPPPTRRSRRRR